MIYLLLLLTPPTQLSKDTPKNLVFWVGLVFIPSHFASVLLKFLTLINSGSTDCFIDSKYVEKNFIPTSEISPMNLQLFDGSLAPKPIRNIASLPIHFPSGEIFDIDFFVTPLDSSCKAVLGYNFLHRYNPLVDWTKGTLTFPKQNSTDDQLQTSTADIPAPLDSSRSEEQPEFSGTSPKQHSLRRARSLQEKFPYEPIYTYPSVSQMASITEDPDKIDIAFVGAAAFH